MVIKKKSGVAVTVAKRAREPSTWAGFAAIIAALAPVFPQYGVVLTAGSVIAGAMGALIPERVGS